MRTLSRVIAALILIVATAPHAGAATGDKQLARVRGTVQYQTDASAAFKPILGRLVLPDDAVAVTLADSQGLLKLADSSEIDVGAKARFHGGAFNALTTGKPNVVTLELGAIHFVVRHPSGARANYVFVTPTSQIGVRGTEGYIVTGPSGTDFYCATCSAGDVTMKVGGRSIRLVTGQQVIVEGADAESAKTSVFKAPCSNPAAIAVSHGRLGRTIPRSKWDDTTGSLGADPLQAPK